jgi:hypothetical protein
MKAQLQTKFSKRTLTLLAAAVAVVCSFFGAAVGSARAMPGGSPEYVTAVTRTPSFVVLVDRTVQVQSDRAQRRSQYLARHIMP